jgi:hypothetical protein
MAWDWQRGGAWPAEWFHYCASLRLAVSFALMRLAAEVAGHCNPPENLRLKPRKRG